MVLTTSTTMRTLTYIAFWAMQILVDSSSMNRWNVMQNMWGHSPHIFYLCFDNINLYFGNGSLNQTSRSISSSVIANADNGIQ